MKVNRRQTLHESVDITKDELLGMVRRHGPNPNGDTFRVTLLDGDGETLGILDTGTVLRAEWESVS